LGVIGSTVLPAAEQDSDPLKGLSKASQLTGIDRVELQELVAHQMIDQRAATLLQANQNFALCTEALLKLTDPLTLTTVPYPGPRTPDPEPYCISTTIDLAATG
jgi:hypothetical protein